MIFFEAILTFVCFMKPDQYHTVCSSFVKIGTSPLVSALAKKKFNFNETLCIGKVFTSSNLSFVQQ